MVAGAKYNLVLEVQSGSTTPVRHAVSIIERPWENFREIVTLERVQA